MRTTKSSGPYLCTRIAFYLSVISFIITSVVILSDYPRGNYAKEIQDLVKHPDLDHLQHFTLLTTDRMKQNTVEGLVGVGLFCKEAGAVIIQKCQDIFPTVSQQAQDAYAVASETGSDYVKLASEKLISGYDYISKAVKENQPQIDNYKEKAVENFSKGCSYIADLYGQYSVYFIQWINNMKKTLDTSYNWKQISKSAKALFNVKGKENIRDYPEPSKASKSNQIPSEITPTTPEKQEKTDEDIQGHQEVVQQDKHKKNAQADENKKKENKEREEYYKERVKTAIEDGILIDGQKVFPREKKSSGQNENNKKFSDSKVKK